MATYVERCEIVQCEVQNAKESERSCCGMVGVKGRRQATLRQRQAHHWAAPRGHGRRRGSGEARFTTLPRDGG